MCHCSLKLKCYRQFQDLMCAVGLDRRKVVRWTSWQSWAFVIYTYCNSYKIYIFILFFVSIFLGSWALAISLVRPGPALVELHSIENTFIWRIFFVKCVNSVLVTNFQRYRWVKVTQWNKIICYHNTIFENGLLVVLHFKIRLKQLSEKILKWQHSLDWKKQVLLRIKKITQVVKFHRHN